MRYEQHGYPSVDLKSPPLQQLALRARAEIAALAYPAQGWVQPRAGFRDVAIVGGGQSALGIAFGLKRLGIADTVCLERAARGHAGPWLGYARMATLRTPKDLVGLEYGHAALGFRAWYEAQFGASAWQGLERIARVHWAAYLDWYADVTEPEIRYATSVARIEPVAGGFKLHCQTSDDEFAVHARRVVLATGFEGSGAWDVPGVVKNTVDPALWAHSNGPLPREKIAGKRVAILGHGASAFDNAAYALDNGAASVDLCFRRPKLPEINPHRWAEFAGFLDHFYDLPDALRWQLGYMFRVLDQPPTKNGVAAASAYPNFRVRPGADWQQIENRNGALSLRTATGAIDADFLICATGLASDLALRPELADLCGDIALWADRYAPPADQTHAGLGVAPYLGPAFEFLEKRPGTAPWLANIQCFSFSASVSHGGQCTSISGHKFSLPRLTRGLARSFFLEQAGGLAASLAAFDAREILLPDPA